MIMDKECKDCRAEDRAGAKLAAPYPGPRCYRHYQARRKRNRAKARAGRLGAKFGLTEDEYQRLYAAQGEACAGCGLVRGGDGSAEQRQKRLPVDHDHGCPSCGGQGCRSCVRGLLCDWCNRTVARFQEQPWRIERLARYLENPPAQAVLASMDDVGSMS
jgi:hypothetical protein